MYGPCLYSWVEKMHGDVASKDFLFHPEVLTSKMMSDYEISGNQNVFVF